jgi:hypothetical protein
MMALLRGYYTGVKFAQKVFGLAVISLLCACSFGGAQPTATLEVPTLAPATATAPPSLVLLLAPEGSDATTLAFAADAAATYANSNGLAFEQLVAMTQAELPPNLAVLLILAPDPGAAELAAAAPTARVITLGFEPAVLAANMVSISTASASSNTAAFIAGYVAELTAEDWRAGMLYTPATAGLVEDFVAGGEYYCGACMPVAPPYIDYPAASEAADITSWQAAADQLLIQSIQVVFLTPELEASGAAQYLADYGVLIIGYGAPPAELSASWLVSINADTSGAVRQQLANALAGSPLTQSSAVGLTNPNPAYLSQARLDNVQLVIDDLLSGYLVLPSAE